MLSIGSRLPSVVSLMAGVGAVAWAPLVPAQVPPQCRSNTWFVVPPPV